MLTKIYKEYLPIQPNVPIYAHEQGEILTIENQHEHLVVYFNKNSKHYHKYNIYLLETGKEVNTNNAKYFKTIMLENGDYVLHIYVEELE